MAIPESKLRTATHYRWDQLPSEKLKGAMSRRVVISERMMLGQVTFAKGDEVPRHAHENEQVTYVLKGALQLWIGADTETVVIVRAGELVVIPSNLPHRALALEDTLELDVFCPPRQDWLSGTDAYLRA